MLIKALVLSLSVTACLAVPPKIIRPCKFDDYKCIGKNFAANSRCNVNVRGFVPAEYVIDTFTYDTAYFNATYIDKNLRIRNHDKCVVSEFFFNMKSDTAVIALDCPYLQFQSIRKLIQHVSLREDLIYHYNYIGTYPLVRLTINLPRADVMNLCSAHAFADVAVMPTFRVIPIDYQTASFLSSDTTYLHVFERENMQPRAAQLARFFINSMICDFKCNV